MMPSQQSSASIDDVRAYWEANPLYSYELSEPGTPQFFKQFDDIKRNDVERFALKYWEFEDYKNKSVLDVGCGPGWLTAQYARAGAKTSSIDLTDAAVKLAKQHVQHYGVTADIKQGSAENIPFADESFDLVFSSGVLHHTPDTQKSFRECFRVLKKGGRAKITLYRLGILHSRFIFPITRFAMKMLSVKHPGADLANDNNTVFDFVRAYDGAGNPVGIAKTNADWAKDLETVGYRVDSLENHFFPKRFVPAGKYLPAFVHYILDRAFGTMVYYNLTKI